MVLQFNRPLGAGVAVVIAIGPVAGRAKQGLFMVQYQAVLNYRGAGGPDDFVVRVPSRRLEDDVVGLPFSRRPAGVDQRRGLPVKPPAHAVGIGGIIIIVKDLDFVKSENDHTTVAALLAFALDLGWLGPFQVQLKAAELSLV